MNHPSSCWALFAEGTHGIRPLNDLKSTSLDHIIQVSVIAAYDTISKSGGWLKRPASNSLSRGGLCCPQPGQRCLGPAGFGTPSTWNVRGSRYHLLHETHSIRYPVTVVLREKHPKNTENTADILREVFTATMWIRRIHGYSIHREIWCIITEHCFSFTRDFCVFGTTISNSLMKICKRFATKLVTVFTFKVYSYIGWQKKKIRNQIQLTKCIFIFIKAHIPQTPNLQFT